MYGRNTPKRYRTREEMENTNKQAVISAIWENPARLFGGEWRQNRNSWEYITGGDWSGRGSVRLLRTRDGEGITVFFNHGSGRAGETPDVFTFVQERDGLGGFWETLQRVAGLYNVPLEISTEQREKMGRAQLAREVFPSLREALRLNPQGEAAKYLTETRRFEAFGEFFGELSPDSLERAKNALKSRGEQWNAADWEALGLTEKRAAAGYSVVIPYYQNGQIRGFLLRNTRKDATGPKYLFSSGLKRGAYCQQLKHGEPAYIVEGELDAIRLLQAAEQSDGAIKNVVAMGTAKPGEELAALLRSHGITSVVYVCDVEHDNAGKLKTDITAAAVRGFQSLRVEGEPVIKSLEVVELSAPQGATLNGLKVDADSYGRDNGAAMLAGAVQMEARPAWAWELERLTEWEREHRNASGLAPAGEIQERFGDIYTRSGNPYNRELIKRAVGSGALAEVLARYGITPAALNDTDEWNRNREYNNRVKQAAEELNKAVQEQANPETVGAIVRRLSEAQGANTRAEWAAQLSETFADELEAIKEQPDTLRTIWEVGGIAKNGTYYRTEYVEFYPADITVFCAPTSHGKTMILFQAALNAVRDTPKTYIYVSCEENKRQLTERALNVALDIPTTPRGTDTDCAPCFITGTRKRTIKAIIRGTTPPPEYEADTLVGSQLFGLLTARVKREITRYAEQIRPRLKFVHTEGSAESITANILYFVEQYRAAGVEVGGVFVDYMQLLTTDARSFSRHDELKDICKALKDCAARTELPVIIAAQLNRDVLKQAVGIDNISVANIGEGADVERIAHDIFLLWQVDKTPLNQYTETNTRTGEPELKPQKLGYRSKRLFTLEMGHPENAKLKRGYLYVEQMKARDGKTEGWGLFPFDGERGYIGPVDMEAMKQ